MQKTIPGLKLCRIYTGASVIFGIVQWCSLTYHFGNFPHSLAIYILYLFYKCYQIVIIHCFILEVREEKEDDSSLRNMTPQEMMEFMNGFSIHEDSNDTSILEYNSLGNVSSEIFSLQTRTLNLQYKKCFEIDLNNLSVDLSSPLGSGAYGCVYKAALKQKNGDEKTIAVKTTKPLEVNIHCFKALLLELKVMTHLGEHKNIVAFLGASITEIRTRKLLIALEFCSLGNLSNYLKSSQGVFVNLLENGKLIISEPQHQHEVENGEAITTSDLIRWSYEISLGMEFLATHKVVHGDLAARNILLTEHRVTKITDFGLARQLYSYSVYVKKQNTPLPWRHMALESVLDMSFSTSSDVWSYGITLWEIFTLAQTPYTIHNFNMEFVEQLKQGMRLCQPHFAPTNIYGMMLQCWKQDNTERPGFRQIASFFSTEFPKEINSCDNTDADF